LDDTRLRAQINEATVVLRAVECQSTAWANHCVTRLWTGYAPALKSYLGAMLEEAEDRGFTVTQDPRRFKGLPREFPREDVPEDFFSRYRAHLLAKSPYYARHGWKEKPARGYWAPAKDDTWQLYSLEP
jgi:hypothetical protein